MGCQNSTSPQFWPGRHASGCLWRLLTPFLPAQLPCRPPSAARRALYSSICRKLSFSGRGGTPGCVFAHTHTHTQLCVPVSSHVSHGVLLLPLRGVCYSTSMLDQDCGRFLVLDIHQGFPRVSVRCKQGIRWQMSRDGTVEQNEPCLSMQVPANSLCLPGFQGLWKLMTVG